MITTASVVIPASEGVVAPMRIPRIMPVEIGFLLGGDGGRHGGLRPHWLLVYAVIGHRVGGDELRLGLAGEDADMDVVLPGKEEAIAHREVRQALALLLSELKDLCQHIHRTGRLLKQELE